MATKVGKSGEKVTLQDGTVVEIKPLSIKRLRDFMEITKQFEKAKDDAEGLDLLVKATQVALLAVDEERFADLEDLEDLLDITTIADIMRISGGVDIDSAGNPQMAGI
jgi:hypothetical protein